MCLPLSNEDARDAGSPEGARLRGRGQEGPGRFQVGLGGRGIRGPTPGNGPGRPWNTKGRPREGSGLVDSRRRRNGYAWSPRSSRLRSRSAR
jgi:hypothetical protein